MLTAYRRHTKRCAHRSEGRKYRRCRCPIWVDGFLNGVEMRESLELTNWEKAQTKIRDWEAAGTTAAESLKAVKVEKTEADRGPTVKGACEEFLSDAEGRKLRDATISKYRVLFRHMQEFASNEGILLLEQLSLPALRKFRASWPDSNISALKKLERLRAFLRFAQESGWVAHSPAAKLKSPRVTDPPTMPFSREQMVEILSACDKYADNYGRTGQANARRLRALVLSLRYSGLRIRDAVTLPRARVTGNRLFLYTAKTGVPVQLPLPDFVIEALDAAPRSNDQYFFWTGESNPKSAVGDWQRSLRKLFDLAQIPDGHAHRFRDTFAVELLLAGIPIERVSVLLGHRSLKVTEKHYAPWVRARQEQMEADVRRSWSEDPILFAETKGTPKVHEKREVLQ